MNAGILLVLRELMAARWQKGGRRFAALLAGASIGAGCVQLLVLCVTENYPAYLAVSFLVLIPGMVLAVFGREPVPVFLRRLAVSYVVAAVLGGSVGALENLLHWNQIPLWLLLVGVLAGKEGVRLLAAQQKKQEQLCAVVLRHRGLRLDCTALWDTGNCLREPERNRPVHIISKEVFRRLQITAGDYVGLAGYASLGRTDGLLPLYEIDALYVADADRAGEAPGTTKAVVACAGEHLLAQKTYQVILNVEGAGV